MAAIRVEFTDSKYRWAHGKAPRGYGWWFFTYRGQEFQYTGTLTEAKEACRKHIRETIPADFTGTVRVNIES